MVRTATMLALLLTAAPVVAQDPAPPPAQAAQGAQDEGLSVTVTDENAWQDYLWWQAQDRRVLKRINVLLADIQRNGNEGIGKPEPMLRFSTMR